jgi:hypothetical protein
MAATELMDRKMDCCEVPASYYTGLPEDSERFVPPRPPPQGLDDEFACLPWKHLTSREASYISFQMLGCLQAFLSGSSMAESTFSCLHAHAPVLQQMQHQLFGRTDLALVTESPAPDRYPQFFLFTCAVALVDATDMARNIVVNADIYEEEDFSPNAYDIPIHTDTCLVPTLQLIDEATKLTSEVALTTTTTTILQEINRSILGFLRWFLSVCTSLVSLRNRCLLLSCTNGLPSSVAVATELPH